jgi:hypothetical protein
MVAMPGEAAGYGLGNLRAIHERLSKMMTFSNNSGIRNIMLTAFGNWIWVTKLPAVM